MSDRTDNTQDPAPQSPANPGAPAEEPGWVSNFFTKLDERLGSIQANVTDDDRNSIAQYVHKLFEDGGAFEREESPSQQQQQQQQSQDKTDEQKPPEKRSKLKGFAARFAGEE